MSELDKKLKSNKNFLVRFRGWFQAAATLLTTLHIPNLFKGKIYQGKAKTMCVPGLNCYSCPAATGACPIGAFQAVVGSSKFKFTYYITGFFILLGVLLGRFIGTKDRRSSRRASCTTVRWPMWPCSTIPANWSAPARGWPPAPTSRA